MSMELWQPVPGRKFFIIQKTIDGEIVIPAGTEGIDERMLRLHKSGNLFYSKQEAQDVVNRISCHIKQNYQKNNSEIYRFDGLSGAFYVVDESLESLIKRFKVQ